MDNKKLSLPEFALHIEPHISKILFELSTSCETDFSLVCSTIFKWASDGYNLNFKSYIPQSLSFMTQAFIEQIMIGHYQKYKSYKGHRKTKPEIPSQTGYQDYNSVDTYPVIASDD